MAIVPDFLLSHYPMTTLLRERICRGYQPTYEEIRLWAKNVETRELCESAQIVTRHYNTSYFELCSIINAKSGRCTEDCRWCAQSRHHKTECPEYELLEESDIICSAVKNAALGVRRFSLVTSGRRLNKAEINKICSHIRALHDKTSLDLCASLGLVDEEDLELLRDAGITRYHCNLETSASYYPTLCSTHSQDEKIKTIKAAQRVGLEVCSGGIIGMGETEEQRIELAYQLNSLKILSIPINILIPIEGTPLAHINPISEDEILRAICLFRLVNPNAHIRLAGGRARLSEECLRLLLDAGVNAAIVGNMLTTIGSDINTDKERIKKAGYELQ